MKISGFTTRCQQQPIVFSSSLKLDVKMNMVPVVFVASVVVSFHTRSGNEELRKPSADNTENKKGSKLFNKLIWLNNVQTELLQTKLHDANRPYMEFGHNRKNKNPL